MDFWVQALIANSIITLISLGVLPFAPKSQLLISLLVSISIGCLLGDAVFHLIPDSSDYKFAPLFQFLGIWGFFLLERFLTHYHHGHGHEESHFHHHDSNGTLEIFIDGEDDQSERSLIQAEKPFGYLLMIGDAFHNLIDGIAIGSSFGISTSAGISTSIAILLHEIPHELGDFLIMKQSNFTTRRALSLIMFSNIASFIGVGIGFIVFDKWLVGIVAGNFLYLALADLVPEILHSHYGATKAHFCIQNLGIVLGAGAMYAIGVFLE